MILFLAGDAHGQIELMYDRVLELEDRLSVTADWVLQVGNLGVFPDPGLVDRATKLRTSKTDFHQYLLNLKQIPRRTIFICGKHEDHRWLQQMYSRQQLEVVHDLNWLLNGYKTYIEDDVSIVGLGKVYSPKSYAGKPKWGHYSRREVEKACSNSPADILLTQEAGKGIQVGKFLSEAEGVNKICSALHPAIHIHGHYDLTEYYLNPFTGTPTLSLGFGAVLAVEKVNDKFNIIS